MDVELIAQVLDQHHVSVDWFRRRDGWAWWCSCLTDGEEVHPDGDSARTAAARHQAEAVWEALSEGADATATPDDVWWEHSCGWRAFISTIPSRPCMGCERNGEWRWVDGSGSEPATLDEAPAELVPAAVEAVR